MMRDYRADIDGLRAFAVTSVVIYHAAPAIVPAGFVGVDIFFVISGYLIGGILYGKASEGTFSFMDFYARRARRILPALFVVVLASLLFGYFVLGASRFAELSAQAITSLVGLSNIYFWERTDYFSLAAELQPLMMTWSLGVEEQFYVLFPAAMLGIVRLPAAWRVPVLLAVAAISFSISLVMLSRAPLGAFFLLPPRAWELLVGGALAVAHMDGLLKDRPERISNGLSLLGFALMAGSFFAFDHDTAFPGYAVVMPVAGTLLLIHTRSSFLNRRVLSWAPMVFVGLISYSWYLWHWPLMAYARIVGDGSASVQALLGMAVASFGLAILSWRFVEQPFRQQGRRPFVTLLRYSSALACVGLVPIMIKLTDGVPSRLPPQVIAAETILQQGYNTCLVGFVETEPEGSDACLPEGSRVALLGDSHASALAVGVQAHAESKDTSVAHFVKAGCTPAYGFTREHEHGVTASATCGAFLENAVEQIVTDPHIEVVFVGGAWPKHGDRSFMIWEQGEAGETVDGFHALEHGLMALTDRLTKADKKVVLVSGPPILHFDGMERHISQSLPVRRTVRDWLGLGRDDVHHAHAELSAVQLEYDIGREVLHHIAHAERLVWFLDLREQMCATERCVYSHEGEPLYYDSHHLSSAGAHYIDWSVPGVETAVSGTP